MISKKIAGPSFVYTGTIFKKEFNGKTRYSFKLQESSNRNKETNEWVRSTICAHYFQLVGTTIPEIMFSEKAGPNGAMYLIEGAQLVFFGKENFFEEKDAKDASKSYWKAFIAAGKCEIRIPEENYSKAYNSTQQAATTSDDQLPF